jgi:hypothetical protein
VGPMSDREFRWIPDETAEATPVRTGAIRAAVLAVSCIVIGIVIGRLTAAIPARTGSGPPDVVSMPSAKKPAEPFVERPSLALKSDTETSAQKPSASPSPKGEPKTHSPPVVLLNPGTADKNRSAAREEPRARPRPVRERSLGDAPQEDREGQATDDRRQMLSQPARDYQSLREYMLSR